MLTGVLALLGCQLVGEVLVRLLDLQVPGPVAGMLLFLVVLRMVKPRPHADLVKGPELLLEHLQLLFVPAGVGVIVYLGELRDHAVPLVIGLWGSWLVGLVVTGAVATGLLRWVRR